MSFEKKAEPEFPSLDSLSLIAAEPTAKIGDASETLCLSELVDAINAAKSEKGLDLDKVRDALQKYDYSLKEWKRYEFWDEKRNYTRNLIATDYETFSLMLLCWNPGKHSCVHSHAGSECFLRCIQGEVIEKQYFWPEVGSEDTKLKLKTSHVVDCGKIAFINDSYGLHSVGNPSPDKGAITLHCYMPPYETCSVFLECSTTPIQITSTFYSEQGLKVDSDS